MPFMNLLIAKTGLIIRLWAVILMPTLCLCSLPKHCHCCEDFDYQCDECGHMLAKRNYKFLKGDLEAKPSVVIQPRNQAERMSYVLPKEVVVKKKQIELEKEVNELKKALSDMTRTQEDTVQGPGSRTQELEETSTQRAAMPVEVSNRELTASTEIGGQGRHEKEATTAGTELDASEIFEMIS